MPTNPSQHFADPFADLQGATRLHRAEHGCEAYTFEDGPALTRLASEWLPMRILELGTALGYSACCLAHGSPQAQVDTIEGDGEHARLAQAYIAQRGLSARISVHHGQFDTVLARLLSGYDMVFFDGYAPPLDILLPLRRLLADGGLLICSNLQLGVGVAARRVAAELADPAHWQQLDPIEGRRTAVLRKQPSRATN